MRNYFGKIARGAVPLVLAGALGGCPIFPEESYTPRTSYLMMKQEDRDIFLFVNPYYDFPEDKRPHGYVGPVETISFLCSKKFTYGGGEKGNMFRFDPDTFIQGDEVNFALEKGQSFWIDAERKLRLEGVFDEEIQLDGEDSPRKFKKAIVVEDVLD